jgi:hypothetical protein
MCSVQEGVPEYVGARVELLYLTYVNPAAAGAVAFPKGGITFQSQSQEKTSYFGTREH